MTQESPLRGMQIYIDEALPFMRMNDKGKEEAVHIVKLDGRLNVSKVCFHSLIRHLSKN